ncbi:MBL fold metallo-hydrolase [Halioglobus maricola]|uniref:MBL fold metallo-hydrolase n=1 Tax=Halioglobus maricola TaxID=2601894 RepID=A0A5P9NNJ1_9GAMM|nr:MBL fold metallo-hydrolase [Halioglobus maricola]QFU77433.1 MBL fold metallo-hydrolase [Halioglobus maricola]
MNTSHAQKGAIAKIVIIALAVLVAGGAWIYFDEDSQLKKQAQLKALDVIGDAATKRLGGEGDGEATHGSAVELIKRPIEVKKLAENVYQATGVGNVMMIVTDEGNVIFDTGLVIQTAKQLEALKAVSDAPIRKIVLSHSHADHIGGTRFFAEEGTEIIAHDQFEEEQRYLMELEPHQYARNRTLFPWMPAWEDRPDIAMMRYGGIEPDVVVDDWETHSFTLGGVEFQVIGTPGAEGADNVVLWLPQQKMLFSGDFFGPQFPQFPNVFTMRGEKIRKPMEYVQSLDLLLALPIETVVPSHLDATTGQAQIAADMRRIRDAVQYVHDETVAGMNAGKDVYALMREIQLPAELELVQNHGKVSWAVRSIYDYYMTWFHFDSTTELYPVPARDIYSDLAEVAGSESLLALGRNYLLQGEPVKALHVVEVVLAAESANIEALNQRQQALGILLDAAEHGLRNDYEIYWLQARMADTAARLDSPAVDR